MSKRKDSRKAELDAVFVFDSETFKHAMVGLWNELSLLVVGTAFLWFSTLFTYSAIMGGIRSSYGIETFSADYVYLAIRFGLLAVGLLCYLRWVSNKAKWEPQYHGKWIAITTIALITATVTVLVAAIVKADILLQVAKGLLGK